MNVLTNLFIYFLFVINICSADEANDGCEQEIYKKCHHETTFTDEEVENAKLFIQNKFSKTRPIGKPCERLNVRKDIKCLSDSEIEDLVAVIRQMHESGFMDKMTEIHHRLWPAVHKYDVGVNWHRWFIMVFEKEMLRINPKVTLPYWDHFNDFAEPHKSKIWDLFGHAGTAANDYCVADGPFANMTFKVPTPHCLRRQFKPDGTMNPWEGPEWATSFQRRGIDFRFLVKGSLLLGNWSTLDTIPRTLKAFKNAFRTYTPLTSIYSQYVMLMTFTGHFKTHLSVGGFNGDMSRSYAPNDPIFYVFHATLDLSFYKYQLSSDENLMSNNFDAGIKYDFKLKRTAIADLKRDVLPEFTDISLIETFQLGYGELCYVHDQLIKPINQLMKGHYSPIPKAVERLKTTLPETLFELYYPKFALYPNKVTIFDHMMTEIPDHCNAICRPTPVAYNYVDTPEGLRAWNRFKNDLGMDMTKVLTEIEKSYLRFMGFINGYQYCSPYVV